jgi:cobalt/nickel transport protein
MKLKLEYIVLGIILIFAIIFTYNVYYGDHEWSGADVNAGNMIDTVTGGSYKPWFNPVFEPPSGEVETFMFAFQSAIGAIIVGYFLGYWRGSAKAKVAVPPKEGDSPRHAP